MALFERFERWQPEDFDAYLESKWSSNRFNPERQRVRERVKSLVEQAVAQAEGVAEGLEVWAARHEPNFFNQHAVRDQLVLLTRPAGDREALEARDVALSATRPDRCHPHLGLRIDADGVELLLRVPEEAGHDRLHLPDDAVAHAQELGALLGATPGLSPVDVVKRWSRQEALATEDPGAQMSEWLSLAAPILLQLLRPVGLTSTPAAIVTPTAAEAPATAPPAKTQAGARPYQPYRPQVPVPPRRPPVAERPSLDRILPLGMRQLIEEQAQLQREAEEQEHRRRESQRHDAQRPEAQRPEARRADPQRRDSHGPPWRDRAGPGATSDSGARQQPPGQEPRPGAPQRDPRLQPDPRGGSGPMRPADPRHQEWRTDDGRSGDSGRQDPRWQPERRPDDRRPDDRRPDDRRPDDRRPDDRKRGTPAPDDRRPDLRREREFIPAALPAGTRVVLGTGLLAGKEGVVVSTAGPKAKVQVGSLEFEVHQGQLRPL